MSDAKRRRRIATEAARLMYERVESEYFTAKRKAAARLGIHLKHPPQDLPSNREVRSEIQVFARVHEGQRCVEELRDMRLAALRMMRLLAPFHPRLIGSVVTGHVRKGSDIDIHVFSDNVAAITGLLELHNYRCDVERKRVRKHNTERVFTHVHVCDDYAYELTVYAADQVTYTFKSSVTGKAIERASIRRLEELVVAEHPEANLCEEAGAVDPFLVWWLLLPPLEAVKQDPQWHPEGDALYHSLQAFEIARDEYPYDEELIASALLHDVGKATDPSDHVAAGLEALEGTLTDREAFLIGHHMEALAYRNGTLGARRRVKLRASEWFEDLMTLRDIDDRAREIGAEVCTVDEAVAVLREMAEADS